MVPMQDANFEVDVLLRHFARSQLVVDSPDAQRFGAQLHGVRRTKVLRSKGQGSG